MGCKGLARVGTTIGEQGNLLYIWTRDDLVGAMEGVGVVSEMRRMDIRGSVTVWDEVGGVDGRTLGSGTDNGRAMVSIHCPNRP